MTGIIEWTHDAQCASRPDLGITLQSPRWADDHLHGILFETDKEYDFFAAVAGVRSRFEKPPLISPRGVPSHLSGRADDYFAIFGEEVAGWLHLSEIEKCISHLGVPSSHLGFEIVIALDLMRLLVTRLSDSHVRMVFNIEG